MNWVILYTGTPNPKKIPFKISEIYLGAIITSMSKISQSKSQRTPAGHLLILGCSDRKIKNPYFNQVPAFAVYDGPSYRVLQKFLRENEWPPGLIIKIVSAKHEIIDATELIEPYDERLDKKTAEKIGPQVMRKLEELELPASVFICMDRDHHPAISCITNLFGSDRIKYAEGKNGKKQQALKQWLHSLPNSDERPCLYFFPDWDDYVYEPFHAEETDEIRKSKDVERKYAHEVFEDDPPYDGLLVSLAQLRIKNGRLSRLDKKDSSNFRDEMRVPNELLLFGDCGAFSYIKDSEPSLSCEDAASLYDQFGFDLGTSVDHIPISSLPQEEKEARMNLTAKNAKEFLDIHREHKYQFLPIGSIQGITPADYAGFVSEYIEWGYKHIALGGLVRRQDSDILEVLAVVREALQRATRGKNENIWVHLFGILRPKLQPIFRELGVSSFDSASYLRKAWASQNMNYFTADGKWYGSIRIPFSTSKAMREVAEQHPEYSNGTMQELEEECLLNLRRFDAGEISEEKVLKNINEYSALLPRKNSSNNFSKKHEDLLKERPWEKCECKVCQDAGIHMVVFRGANRNRRRGFHNTWVFYHKILHGGYKKPSKK